MKIEELFYKKNKLLLTKLSEVICGNSVNTTKNSVKIQYLSTLKSVVNLENNSSIIHSTCVENKSIRLEDDSVKRLVHQSPLWDTLEPYIYFTKEKYLKN